jgi:hypothetical protein
VAAPLVAHPEFLVVVLTLPFLPQGVQALRAFRLFRRT